MLPLIQFACWLLRRGLKIKGKKEEDVFFTDLTVTGAKKYGVYGDEGAAMHLKNVCVEKCGWNGVKVYTTCANTNGMTSNTAETDCKCGSSDCTSSSGYYCTRSTSTCALVGICATTHVANSNKAATNSITGTLTN